MCTIGKRSTRPRAGFTLVEIIVVITIIAVLLAMATISMSGALGGVSARESAGNLLSTLRYAHDYAAIHSCECRVTFSRARNSYECTFKSDAAKSTFERMPGGSHIELSEPVKFVSIRIQAKDAGESADVVTFEPTGEADAASIVISDGRAAYSLIVAPSTGLVQLKSGASLEVVSDREDLDA